MAEVTGSGIHGNTFVSFTLYSELPRPTVSLHAEPFTPRVDNSSTVEFEIQFHVVDNFYFLLHFLPAVQLLTVVWQELDSQMKFFGSNLLLT